jgi:hypothetical protein
MAVGERNPPLRGGSEIAPKKAPKGSLVTGILRKRERLRMEDEVARAGAFLTRYGKPGDDPDHSIRTAARTT